MTEAIPLQTQIELLINKVMDICPVCGNNGISHLETVYWKSVKISYFICNQCSIVFQNPRMDTNNTDIYYEKYYRLFNDGNDLPTTQQLAYQQGRADYFEQRLKPFTQGFVERSNYLDIGSSGGILLEMIKTKYPRQFNIYGIEPGNAYREFSISNGFKVFEDIPSLVADAQRKFSLITMSHVLEHLSDPVAYLKKISEKVISENGLMMIEVPNYYGHYSYELSHNYCFTKKSLTNVIQLAGFETVSLVTHAKPNFTFRHLYLNIVIKPSRKSMHQIESPAWLVKLKRRIAPTDNSKISWVLLNYLKRFVVKMRSISKRTSR